MDRRGLATLAAVGLVAACAAREVVPVDSLPATDSAALNLVSAVLIPTTNLPRARRVSGISGLAYDPANRAWIAVSDDRQAPRWFVCDFALEASRVRFTASPPVMAKPPISVRGRPRVPDFEAVAILPGGDLLIASEGERVGGRRFPASIMRFKRDGSYIGDVEIPDRYLPPPEGRVERGMRDNHGFEGIALAPDASHLWAVAEAPLLQDDAPADDRRGARSRLIEFAAEGDTFRAVRELVYPLDPVRIPPGLGPGATVVDQGVSELTVLDDGTLFSLERAFVRDRTRRKSANVVYVFRLDLNGADDVSAIESLRDAPGARAIRKTLVRDLSGLMPAMPPYLATLENFEAMAPGPASLGDSLVLMSDDNFSERQVTAAIVLSLGKAATP